MTLKHRSYPGFQFGSSLILVILTTLSLVVLAVLSLSTALQDYKYSKLLAEQTTAYYEANNDAYQILEQIDTAKDLRAIPGLTIEGADPQTISFEVPMEEQRALEVQLRYQDSQYHIIKWKETSHTTWESNTTLPVLGSH